MILLPPPLPSPGQRTRHSGLHGSSDALALARLAQEARPLVILAETAWHAQRLRDEIAFFAPQLAIHLLPDWETLPYDHFSPHQDLVSERLATLYQISHNACDVIIVPATTALCRLPPREFLAAHAFFLKQGTKLDLDALRQQLTQAGYTHVTQVLTPGEYSIRGGLVDLFPMGSAVPYRLDLFDQEIESIRTFDVDTQRSIYPVKDVRLLPAREFPLDEAGISRFRQSFREKFEGDPSKSQLYKDVSNGLAPLGIEYYLPLFFEHTATLFDYLPESALLCLHHDLEGAAQHFWQDTRSRYMLLRGDRNRPLLSPEEIFLPVDVFFGEIKLFGRIEISSEAGDKPITQPVPPVQVERRAEDPLEKLKTFIEHFDGRVLILAESMGRRETMAQYLAEYGLKPAICENFSDFEAGTERLMLAAGMVSTGFILSTAFAVITETELYASQVRQSRRRDTTRRSNVENMLRDLSELRAGDPVVHEQHGIGRYLGLVNMDLGEGETEFLHLEYAGGDKLYVPVCDLHVISRYSGASPDSAPLHRLGSGQWEKAKKRALQQARDTAAELLNLYAQRAARQGYTFKLNHHDYEAFASAFDFEETPDQAAAIQAVIGDMTSGLPMDRLVCGDVGFGKTEVALRAAFVAVADGKQVAILVPTTLLAEQHFNNFSDRFSDWPVKIAELSRFRTAKEQTLALKGLAAGEIDIVIGTHKLIQKDVKFKNLGLVIVDEEHRFGVRQKEQLKALRAEVDVLTLTATPIPRSLSMSLEGLRDFSVIATAPQRRLSIKTFVAPYSEGIIREAVLRELKRGGQVYFLHNEVETILNVQEKLAKLLPEARIAVAHGQLHERDLEHVMRDFYQQRFNILLCTTIIETGIDIPTANTIIMNRADKFGLAQLHQLRGRVGRSHHQAYAYLLTPGEVAALTPQAKKRLDAIQMMEDLGAGFYLSMHDLEIRGAGEILGESQSGEMQEIGFSLYSDMLNQAVKALKEGKEPDMTAPLAVTTEINLHTPALLPKDYCGDINQRLTLYKRLANCDSLEDLDLIHEELIDRFGLLPPAAHALLEAHRLRVMAKPLGIMKIDASSDAIMVQFVPSPPIDPAKIIEFIQKQPGCKLAGPDKIRIGVPLPEVEQRITTIKFLFKKLQ
ncbi:MAG: transcription-repair coupling factor [Gammaproteobacteria bacterium]|nr:transcription-repair coupling factor [Gammaproteobacteria bacterium]MBU1732505.1 transcription-repair coupling factor [Gammaproteobacteria bacterium]MBU1892641.1 transcription-repair coupling factor [Gammaproteobacteria bacterium]